MTARLTILALALATPLGGCASLTGATPPTCDGSARRPLNRSLWDWESARPVPVAPIEAPAPAPAQSPSVTEPIIRKSEVVRPRAEARATALPMFDIAASMRPCRGADHG